MIGGAAGGHAPRLGMRAVTPNPIDPARRAAVDELKREGVHPTAGDVSGKRSLRYGENVFGDAPGSGGVFSKFKEKIGEQYTGAVLRRAGIPNEKRATSEVVNEGFDRAARDMENSGKVLTAELDQKLKNEFQAIERDLLKEGLPDETNRRVLRQMQNISDGFSGRTTISTPSGKLHSFPTMSGETYQGLTRKNTPLARAIDDSDPNVSYYSTRIRGALDDALERSSLNGTPQQVAALQDLKEARKHWYNLVLISKATSGAGEGAAEGIVTPQKLRQMLTSGGDDRKLQYARGRGDLSRLARTGNEIMTPLPDSGTGQRNWVYHMPQAIASGLGSMAGTHALPGEPILGGLGGAVAGTVLPGAAGRALMSKPVQAWLKNQGLSGALEKLPPAQADAVRAFLTSAMAAPWDSRSDQGGVKQ
jgi:hypothetical protein